MELIEREQPHFTDDPYYDIFVGGYIEARDFLKNEDEIEKLENAIALVQKFLDVAEKEGVIEIG